MERSETEREVPLVANSDTCLRVWLLPARLLGQGNNKRRKFNITRGTKKFFVKRLKEFKKG